MDLIQVLGRAVDARLGLLNEQHEATLRLFNGFHEGAPDLAIDLYARTLLFHNYASEPEQVQPTIQKALGYLIDRFPWLQCVVEKIRLDADPTKRRGFLLFGKQPDRRIQENGVAYAIDLLLNRDASFYLDTRNLRVWLKENLTGKTVLNTFSYTGSLGVAAMAGGASRVIQLDRSRVFLNLAKTSYTLNGFPIDRSDFRAGDFFTQTSQMRRHGETFDCVICDPPFFSSGDKGSVDLNAESNRLLNKVRPLVSDGGWLVAVNNALFVSGTDYMNTLEDLCRDNYLSIDRLIPVPEDITGVPATIVRSSPVDPAPFNHSTKIAVLRVKRKLNMSQRGGV